ncbi:MAG: hypothetical protein WC761_02265 [Candidatus Paceibacterota bacterium]|jgi:hypothetical protein
MSVSHTTEPTFDYSAGNNSGIRVMSVFNITWQPVKGKIYRQVDPTLSVCAKPIIPGSSIITTNAHGLGKTATTNERSILYREDEHVVLYLGERQRIPDHYTFFKVLWQERPWWVYYQEVVFSYCFGRPPVFPLDYNYPVLLV